MNKTESAGLIQIAGISDQAEADLLVEGGVDWLGFPFRLDVHQEDLTVEAAARIIRRLPASVFGVLITYLNEEKEIVRLANRLGVQHIHLHGEVSAELLRDLHQQSKWVLIKSLVVRNGNLEELLQDVRRFAPYVDAFITDTFDPESGASGATGRTHNWQMSRKLVSASPRPIILAGGLRPGNVGQAIQTVRPAGVDVHTGVEDAGGRKDPQRVHQFVQRARQAFRRFPPVRPFNRSSLVR